MALAGTCGGDHPSRSAIADSLKQHTHEYRAGSPQTLAHAHDKHARFCLAPGGVYLAGAITCPAGALLPHLFTLTESAAADGKTSAACSAVYFLWHYSRRSPWVAVSNHHAHMESGLSSTAALNAPKDAPGSVN